MTKEKNHNSKECNVHLNYKASMPLDSFKTDPQSAW